MSKYLYQTEKSDTVPFSWRDLLRAYWQLIGDLRLRWFFSE